MAGVINLRTARKRAERKRSEQRADAHRLAHGRPKHERKLADMQRSKASRDLEHHRIDGGDGG